MLHAPAKHPRILGTVLAAAGLLMLGVGLAASRYSDAIYLLEGTSQDNPTRQVVELVLVVSSIILGLALLVMGTTMMASEGQPEAALKVPRPPNGD